MISGLDVGREAVMLTVDPNSFVQILEIQRFACVVRHLVFLLLCIILFRTIFVCHIGRFLFLDRM